MSFEITKPIAVSTDYANLFIDIATIHWRGTDAEVSAEVFYYTDSDAFKSGADAVTTTGLPQIVKITVDTGFDTIDTMKQKIIDAIAVASKGLFESGDVTAIEDVLLDEVK